ncbi:hypothetical protein [Lacisediminimonas profundi]|uniref:hypothetical protein n=1 Tax=Lacisediminimonas profundi TaxID=2603856 RepID=UPI00124B94F5|nr:hypothetical protein [Lacisediminimonas profundi]
MSFPKIQVTRSHSEPADPGTRHTRADTPVTSPPGNRMRQSRDHVVDRAQSESALANVKDQRTHSSKGQASHSTTPGNVDAALPGETSKPARLQPLNVNRLIARGARPNHIEQARSRMPHGNHDQILAFCLLCGIGVLAEDAGLYACEEIGNLDKENPSPDRLGYCSLRAAGFKPRQAAKLCNYRNSDKAKYFQEATFIPNPGSDRSVKINYCAMRVLGNSSKVATWWAHAGPNAAVNLCLLDQKKLTDLYVTHTNSEPLPQTFPRFVGNSISMPGEKKKILGKGGFNQVELVKILDPETNQERKFAFKPSKSDARVGLGGALTGIRDLEDSDSDGEYNYCPERRNLAAVAVARLLGLAGDDGVTGNAFMGIVDKRLGLLMEVVPGKPVAQADYNIALGPDLPHYKQLYDSRQMLVDDPNLNRDISKIMGVHSIRFKKNDKGGVDILLTGSVTPDGQPDNLEPFRNNDASLKKAYARIEFFDELINETDGHPGNIMIEQRPDGRYCARRIDLDQCFGAVRAPDLQGEESFMTYYLPQPVRFMEKMLADKLREDGMRDALEETVLDLLTSEEEVDAFLIRYDAIVQGLEGGEIEIVDDSVNDDGWKAADMSDPHTSLFARDGQRPKLY